MKTEEKSEKINRILGIISAVIGIVGSIFGIFQAQQAATLKNEVNSLQTASQQTIVNVVSTLGDDAKTSELTETGDMVAATDQLISVYSSTKTQNAQLTSEAQTLQSENEALKAQVENLKSVLLNTYSMDEVDKVVAQGYLDEVETKRLDNLEMLDIGISIIIAHFKMQMRSRCTSCMPHIGYNLPCLYLLTHCDTDSGTMRIQQKIIITHPLPVTVTK